MSDTAAAYDVVAPDYARLLPDDGFEAPLDRAMLEDFAERVRSTSTRRVIDAGCGAGRMAPVLGRHGLEYMGVDSSSVMVDTAGSLHPDYRFEVGDLAALPAPDSSAGGVLAWYSVIHTDPSALAGVLTDFRRVLHVNGYLLLGFQVGVGERRMRRPYGHDVELVAQLHDPVLVQQYLQDAGFRLEATLVRGPRTTERDPQAVILAMLDQPRHASEQKQADIPVNRDQPGQPGQPGQPSQPGQPDEA